MNIYKTQNDEQMSQQGHSSLFKCILYSALQTDAKSPYLFKKNELVFHNYFHTIKN